MQIRNRHIITALWHLCIEELTFIIGICLCLNHSGRQFEISKYNVVYSLIKILKLSEILMESIKGDRI